MRALGQILALVDVQLRCLLNAFRQHGHGRAMLVSLALSVVWYGLWLTAAVASAVVPSLVGRTEIERALPGLLFMMMAYWQLAPVITMSLGVSLQMRKVTIYPVTTPTLFAVECLLRLGTGLEMVLLLCGLFVGLAAAGTPHPLELALAFLLFVTFNVLLSAGVRNTIERIFQRRKLREVVVLLVVSATLLPQVLVWSARAREVASLVLAGSRSVPYWVLPSGLAGRLGVGEWVWSDLGLLGGMIAMAAIFGYRQFRNGCRPDNSFAASAFPRARPGQRLSLRERLVRAPSRVLLDPVGALVEKEIVYLWRSPRFRLPFFMGFTFGVIAWVPLMKQWESSLGRWMENSSVTLISLYALLLLGPVLFLNRFGFDRGAARFYFWLPLSMRRLLVAKNLTSLIYGLLEVALVAVTCTLIGLTITLPKLAEAFGVALIALLYLLSVGNHMSVRFPSMSNPDRVSRAGPGHGVAGMVQFLLFPLSLTPIFAAFIVRHRGGGQEGFLLLLAAAAVGGCLLYLAVLDRSARYAEHNRELLLSHLSQEDGPVASE
jgi:ABC-2 type transport system permease protein